MPSMEWEGLAGLDQALIHWVEKMPKATETAIRDGAQLVVTEARASFGGSGPHSRSGRLQQSITFTAPKVVGLGQYEAQVGPSGVVYARKVELGKHSPRSAGPHPFLRPGFNRARTKLVDLFAAAWATAQKG